MKYCAVSYTDYKDVVHHEDANLTNYKRKQRYYSLISFLYWNISLELKESRTLQTDHNILITSTIHMNVKLIISSFKVT